MRIAIENKEFEAYILEIVAPVRYWEDCSIHLVNDDRMGDCIPDELIPCREGENWCPIIEIDTGKILNWQQGIEAKVFFKVCDEGSYYLKDEQGETIAAIEKFYVPTLIDLTGKSFGDYLYFSIDENGKIANWQPKTENLEKEWATTENRIYNKMVK